MLRTMARKDDEAMDVDEEPEDDDSELDEDYEEEGMSYRKKFFTIIIVIIVIITAVAAVFALDKDVKDVTVIQPDKIPDGSGIVVKAYSSLEGTGRSNDDGTVKIFYDGDEQYSSSISFKDDFARKEIKYKDFIYDEGEYEIQVILGGKSHKTTFNPKDFDFGIAKYINVTLALEPNEFTLVGDSSARNGPINVHTTAFIKELVDVGGKFEERNPPAPPTDTNIEVTVTHEDGSTQNFTEHLQGVAHASFDDFVYYSSGAGPGPGNYSISAKLINNYIKSNSPMHTVELTNFRTQYLNVMPVAEGGDNITAVGEPRQTTMEINFDASDSWNDGEITQYIWDFDYDGAVGFQHDAVTTSPTVSHTYTKSGSVVIVDIYTVFLQVVGDAYDPILDDGSGGSLTERSVVDEIGVTITWSRL
jgi:hypothetical protein